MWSLVVGNNNNELVPQDIFPHTLTVLDDVPDTFKCAVCLCAMENPVSLQTCGHIFDYNCVHYNGKLIKCPIDRSQSFAVIPLPGLRQHIRETVPVSCTCGKRVTVDAFWHHSINDCSQARFKCTRNDRYGTCGKIVCSKGRVFHEEMECPCVPRLCPSCGEPGVPRFHPEHEKGMCGLLQSMAKKMDHDKDVVMAGLTFLENEGVSIGVTAMKTLVAVASHYKDDEDVIGLLLSVMAKGHIQNHETDNNDDLIWAVLKHSGFCQRLLEILQKWPQNESLQKNVLQVITLIGHVFSSPSYSNKDEFMCDDDDNDSSTLPSLEEFSTSDEEDDDNGPYYCEHCEDADVNATTVETTDNYNTDDDGTVKWIHDAMPLVTTRMQAHLLEACEALSALIQMLRFTGNVFKDTTTIVSHLVNIPYSQLEQATYTVLPLIHHIVMDNRSAGIELLKGGVFKKLVPKMDEDPFDLIFAHDMCKAGYTLIQCCCYPTDTTLVDDVYQMARKVWVHNSSIGPYISSSIINVINALMDFSSDVFGPKLIDQRVLEFTTRVVNHNMGYNCTLNQACRAISLLLPYYTPDKNNHEVQACPSVLPLLEVMKVQSQRDCPPFFAIDAITNIMIEFPSEQAILLECGFISTVLETMKKFKTNHAVQKAGCNALWMTFVGTDMFQGSRRQFITDGGVETVIRALETDGCDDVTVQLHGLDIIWVSSSFTSSRILVRLGIMDLCNKAMKKFSRVQQIQCTSTNLIKLCCKSPFLSAFTVSTTVENVSSAMIFFKECDTVQCNGSGILLQMVSYIVKSPSLIFYQTVTALMTAVFSQTSPSGIRVDACEALTSICASNQNSFLNGFDNQSTLCSVVTKEIVNRCSRNKIVAHISICKLISAVASLQTEEVPLLVAEGTIECVLDLIDVWASKSDPVVGSLCETLDSFIRSGCTMRNGNTVPRLMDTLMKIVHRQRLCLYTCSCAWSCINTVLQKLDTNNILQKDYVPITVRGIVKILEREHHREVSSHMLQNVLHIAVVLCLKDEGDRPVTKQLFNNKIMRNLLSLLSAYPCDYHLAIEVCRLLCAAVQKHPNSVSFLGSRYINNVTEVLLDIAVNTKNHLLGRLASTLAKHVFTTTAQKEGLNKRLLQQTALVLGCDISVVVNVTTRP